MQEILIVIDEMGGVLVETDDGEQQFATGAEALEYVRTLLPAGESEVPADPALDPSADPQTMWDEEAAARPTH